MSKKSKKVFTTGEFAKLCGVKKQTLFHYDDIGLLSPDLKEENGYRYYTYQQIDIFGIISALKELDMSLMEIKEYMDHRSPQSLIDLFERKSIELEKEIIKMYKIRSLMQNRIEITKKAADIDCDLITIQHLPRQNIVLSTSLQDTKGKSYFDIISEYISRQDQSDVYSDFYSGGMAATKDVIAGQDDPISYFFANAADQSPFYPGFYKPEGDYAVAYHKGNYDTIRSSYRRLLAFLNKHKLSIGDYFYEEYIIDEVAVANVNDYIIQIAVEVKPQPGV
ncbi:MerR family transcriptional regulator [Youxingia wuxianensis]|uniref:MerR family transcriptional regulator n=1 Tax=Youxingia wuxianensis TaxID=2763678 RepID=A0A926EMP0_9FIRM|nr:MerR family transcriptional regulator [Youxingia wuxianensis]MBC8584027.1 MerR family transcriptional regulator [Youxingia wuxianensis]